MMYKRNPGRTLVTSLAAVAALSVPYCETAFAADEDEMMEEIIVTGSRIKRDGFSSSSPLDVFDQSDVLEAGVASIDEFLKDIPAFTGYQMGTSTNNGSDVGQKKLDMRGLGFQRTLVLINGRRMIGDTKVDGAVDINNVPEAMVGRIEVLKDGASTIYGSDALAGVVNFILRDEFEGLEFSANAGQGTEDGQAGNNGISMLAGVAGERGNMVMSFSYSAQEEMKQEERPWANQTQYSLHQGNGVFDIFDSGRE